jgi:phosphonate transport system ATP-binding protein
MIELKHVDKIYPNGYKALSDINLTVKDGEFVSIIGLSGAGKSTLIRCINRMHDIQAGQILVDGVDISRLKGKALRAERRNIGMIFQSFNLDQAGQRLQERSRRSGRLPQHLGNLIRHL